MKLDRTFLLPELSKRLSEQIEELAKEHMIGLVNDYNETLRKQGMYIEFRDPEELVKHLLGSANIKLKIAAEVDGVKLNKWHIYPMAANQSRLDDYQETLERRRQAAAEEGGK
jgi:hypothetical protein